MSRVDLEAGRRFSKRREGEFPAAPPLAAAHLLRCAPGRDPLASPLQDRPRRDTIAGEVFGEEKRPVVKATEEILSLLAREKPNWVRRFGLRRLAVFGSYARGEQCEGSDVDVLVEVDPLIGLRFVDLAEEIESFLGVRVDVVSRGAIHPRNSEVIEKELIDVP